MTHGKTYNKSPRRINHKATKSKTNTGTFKLQSSNGLSLLGRKLYVVPINILEKYTANYEMLQGQTVLSSSNAVYQNIYSADECAKLCSNYQEFSCKSFDYCDYISTCYLGKNHYYDLPKADIEFTPICNHYSSKYIHNYVHCNYYSAECIPRYTAHAHM